MTERRFDPTRAEWVTFASHRQNRTFLPATEQCPFCGTRDDGFETEIPVASYDLAVFDNKFPSLTAKPPDPSVESSDLYPVEPALGATEVVLYSSDHSATLAGMSAERLYWIVNLWSERYAVLGAREHVKYVLIFENKGVEVGVTLHHPHGQIYAYPEIPPVPRKELTAALAHLEAKGTCVFCDQVGRERGDGLRVLAENPSFVAFVPFAARYPFEVHILSRRHAASLLDLTDPERRLLAGILLRVLRGYDALFGFSMPYIMGIHQAPTDDGEWQAVSHFHIELTPPYRTATKLKYLAGSEFSAGAFLNDTVPEESAARLREAVESAGG
ncbi:MAG TPA: galactose-1-phosphate uridylyltransferase [Actinomycetota bacterium]|nr:galactose-1-phosphate uridylyltransferase [Actinomycetota bacterium]